MKALRRPRCGHVTGRRRRPAEVVETIVSLLTPLDGVFYKTLRKCSTNCIECAVFISGQSRRSSILFQLSSRSFVPLRSRRRESDDLGRFFPTGGTGTLDALLIREHSTGP